MTVKPSLHAVITRWGHRKTPFRLNSLKKKLRICAGYCLADNKIDELAAAINDIENVGSVRELMTMMRSS